MIDQLPAFIAATMGAALAYELLLLIIFGLMFSLRQQLYRLLRWYRRQKRGDDDQLRAAIWRFLRNR